MERLCADFDLDEEVFDGGGDVEVDSSADSGCWFPFKNKMVIYPLRHRKKEPHVKLLLFYF